MPYVKAQIDNTEFKIDEPSGVIRDRTETTVDGTPATTFFGNNAEMGDTREVLVHQGRLPVRGHHLQRTRLVAPTDLAELALHLRRSPRRRRTVKTVC
jgi:hypothetical protein